MTQRERTALRNDAVFMEQLKTAVIKLAGAAYVAQTTPADYKPALSDILRNPHSYISLFFDTLVANNAFDRTTPLGWTSTDAEILAEVDTVFTAVMNVITKQ